MVPKKTEGNLREELFEQGRIFQLMDDRDEFVLNLSKLLFSSKLDELTDFGVSQVLCSIVKPIRIRSVDGFANTYIEKR